MSKQLEPHVYSDIPAFFWSCCDAARLGGGYSLAGYRLMSMAQRLAPAECDRDEWLQEVDALRVHVERADDDAMLNWFLSHYPRCMSLVPTRRRSSFLRGVRRWASDSVHVPSA